MRLVLVEPEGQPVQQNSYDCGPFVAHFLEHLLDEKRGIFSNEKFMNGDLRWDEIKEFSDVHAQSERQLTKAMILKLAPKDYHEKIEEIIANSLKPTVSRPVIPAMNQLPQ
ncbi:unnamed protein product [Caenorhabditis brenneri]